MRTRILCLGSLLFSCFNAPPEPPAKTLPIPEGCQPLLGGVDCTLPYPSDFFLVPDASTRTGVSVSIPEAAQVSAVSGRADPHTLHKSDGFSRLPTIVALLPDDVSSEGFVGVLSDPTLSLSLSSPTLLIHARTGQLIPHFADLDSRDNEAPRAIVLHPIVQLSPQERYVVVFHNVKRPDGTLASAAEGFARLRDQESAQEPSLAPLQDQFEQEVFSVTSALGLPRRELQLAFSFTTGSKEAPREDMLRVRELTLSFLDQADPQVQNITVQDFPNDPSRCKIIHGEVVGPLFLTSPDTDGVPFRGANGQIEQNGTITIPFSAVVPASVCASNAPTRVLAFGHGFFFKKEQIEDEVMHTIANRLNVVLFSIDWFGMSIDDGIDIIPTLVTDPSSALSFTDRVHQGMANWITMLRAIKGPLVSEAAFERSNNQSFYDPSPMNFLGISQGHILGSVLGSLSPDIERLGLHVGGAGFTHMMFRARPFAIFLSSLNSSVPDSLEQQKLVAMLQEGFDRIDPATYAEFLLENPLPQSPPDRRVLFQTGLGDSEVPNLGSFLHARLLRLPVLSPSPLSIFGLSEVQGPVDGSAVTLYDFGFNLIDVYRDTDPEALEATGVHEGLRLLEAPQAQMDAFFQDNSQILFTCQGVCDPE